MSNQDNNNELNPLEKQLEDINEWQKNSTNPGYYVGTGKVPVPMKNLLKSPIIMIIIGSILAIPTICNLVSNFGVGTILSNILIILISSGLIIGGAIRILKRG